MVRAFTPADYSTLMTWWLGQHFPPIPLKFLPHTGFIIDGVCAGFLYQTDSPIAWVEWIIANPETETTARREALDRLFEAIVARAKELEIQVLFTSVQHPKLLERYKKHGFKAVESNMTNMARYM